MSKKYFISLILICITALVIWFIKAKTITFYWLEPEVDITKVANIANIVKTLDNMYKIIEDDSKHSSAPFEYKSLNIYGSSTNKYNPMPNDLDTSTEIYLGEYNYDGTNELEITESMVDKIENFYYLTYMYATRLDEFVPDRDILELLKKMGQHHMIKITSIKHHLPKAISNKHYLYQAQKINKNLNGKTQIVDSSIMMEPNNLVLEGDGQPITLYTDKIKFNENTFPYIRLITNHPMFFVKIKQNNTSVLIKIHPCNIRQKIFNIEIVKSFEDIIVSKHPNRSFKVIFGIDKDEDFLSKRLFIVKDFLLAINREKNIYKRPMKLHKRLLQCAEMMRPYIGDEKSNQIIEYTSNYLNSRDVQLLNEYENICNSLIEISKLSSFNTIKENGKFNDMYTVLQSVLDEMKNRGNVSQKSIKIYQDFANNEFKQLINTNSKDENFNTYLKAYKQKNNSLIESTINSDYFSFVKDINLLNAYISQMEKVLNDMGYHRIEYYWINSKTMAIIKDDFTKKITDIDSFIKDNDFANITYKIVPNSAQIDPDSISRIYVKYKPTNIENENYQKFMNAYIKEKNKNYKLKRKILIIR